MGCLFTDVTLWCVCRSYLIRVVLSEHDFSKKEGYEQVFNVSKVLVNYLYNYRTFDNDIMLLKVSIHYT